MSTQALFYRQVEPVSAERHAELCVNPAAGYSFAREVNFVPLLLEEFEQAARHYPIVFVQQAGGFLPAAVLGYRAQENLFVDAGGAWDCGYVPAYVRRYPFILAARDGAQGFTLCLDPEHVGCNFERRGEALFLAGGARSAYLENVLAFLRRFQTGLEASTRLAGRAAELGLLEPMQAQVALDAGERLSLGGFHAVARPRLRALLPEPLQTLAADGALELLHLHLFSLPSFARLLDRHAARHPS